MKQINKSKRGLTFTLPGLKIGQKYKYVIDLSMKEIRIIPEETGKITVSKKKCGSKVKPLIDIRSVEVRKLVSEADYIELELQADLSVLVRTKRKVQAIRNNLISIQDILSQNTSEFVIPAQMLAVSGGSAYPTSLFGRATLAEDSYFDYLSSSIPKYFTKGKGKKEIKRVYDVMSLFSGAGMLDKAFMGERFRFVYGVDFEPAAVNTYKANIGDHIQCRDIRTVMPEDIPHADIAIGGPCCISEQKIINYRNCQ